MKSGKMSIGLKLNYIISALISFVIFYHITMPSIVNFSLMFYSSLFLSYRVFKSIKLGVKLKRSSLVLVAVLLTLVGYSMYNRSDYSYTLIEVIYFIFIIICSYFINEAQLNSTKQ